ncbi:MAG: pyridoxamine 5'-phosphate oxidase family protein [Nitrosopumilaceae archaeon]|nr:pyridoxamine 5'-phosphate oxidase family protein [Nitrosopumilaceae archaeon]
MVRVPQDIINFIEEQGVFVVGTVGGNIVNVSPRIFFKVEEDRVYWLDFFEHKSYRNFQTNPWVTISVFNKELLKGYQFRGMVSFITDEPTKSEIKNSIIDKITTINPSEKIKKLAQKDAHVILFEPKVCYSLNPEEHADLCIGSDIDSSQMFQNN